MDCMNVIILHNARIVTLIDILIKYMSSSRIAAATSTIRRAIGYFHISCSLVLKIIIIPPPPHNSTKLNVTIPQIQEIFT